LFSKHNGKDDSRKYCFAILRSNFNKKKKKSIRFITIIKFSRILRTFFSRILRTFFSWILRTFFYRYLIKIIKFKWCNKNGILIFIFSEDFTDTLNINSMKMRAFIMA
jgi:hypothetical protein